MSELGGDTNRVSGERLVFVGGLHRSGTTPLSRVLAAHRDISGLVDTGVKEDEGQHLQSVYPPARTYGGPGRFALAEGAHLTDESQLATAESAHSLWASWAPYWEDASRPLLLEKSPPNMVMGRFLQAVFPGSALIVVVRHPVIVALSTVKWRRWLSRRWWNHTSVYDMVHNWAAAVRLLADDEVHLRRVRVVRYEDLVRDPDGELAALGAFLGLSSPVSPQLWNAGHSLRYEERWRQMLGTRRGRRVLRRITTDFGVDAERYGYDLETLQTGEIPPS